MGNGWALLGDAASFLDPYYSPGLDHASFTAEATAEIVGLEAKGEDIGARIVEHNAAFTRSYTRFFRSIFKDKYYYMGEHDLLAAAMILDTAHYYIFVVMPAYRIAKRFLSMPVLGPKPAFFSYHFIKLYHQRFKAIALARRAAGEEGVRNNGRRIRVYFNLNLAPAHMVLRGVKLWAFAEADNVRLQLRRIFGRRAATTTSPAEAPHRGMSRRVAIVFDHELGDRLGELAMRMPVWIVESNTNRPAVAAAWNRASEWPHISVTVFESPGDLRLLLTQIGQPQRVDVIGMTLTDEVRGILTDAGFATIVDGDGFRAK